MKNIEEFSAYLVKNQNKIDKLLSNIEVLTSSGSKSFKSLKDSADNFKELTTKLKIELEKGTFDVKELSQDSFNNLEIVLKSLDNTLNQTQDLIKI